MIAMKKVAPIAALASAMMLSGCTTDGYGYGGVNVGYGSGYYYDDYPYGPYAPYGWHDDYYYPGNGYWLYDRRGTRHRWSERQRRYWEQRREHGGRWEGPATRPWRPEMREERRWGGRDGNWRGRNDGQQVQRIPRSEVQRNAPQSAGEARPIPESRSTSPAPPQRIERRRRD